MRGLGKARIGSEEVTKSLLLSLMSGGSFLLIYCYPIPCSSLPVYLWTMRSRKRGAGPRVSKLLLSFLLLQPKKLTGECLSGGRFDVCSLSIHQGIRDYNVFFSKCHSLTRIPSCLCSHPVIELSCLLFSFKFSEFAPTKT